MENAEKTSVMLENGSLPEQAVTAALTSTEATRMAAPVPCPVCGTANPALETYCIECGFLLSSQPGTPVAAEEPLCPYALVEETTGRRFPLKEGENLIGREGGDVLLTDTTVSRRHAVLSVHGTAVTITDQGSTNGTRVDGTPIQAGVACPLRSGCVLQLGGVSLSLEGPETSAPEPQTAQVEVTETADERPVTARLVSDGRHPGDILIRPGRTTIGRRASNSHVISGDPYVSGAHAAIVSDGETLTIEDLGSTNGTFVDGRRLPPGTPTLLHDGDTVTIGQGTYTVSIAQKETEPQPTAAGVTEDLSAFDEEEDDDAPDIWIAKEDA